MSWSAVPCAALGRDVHVPPVELAGSMSESGVYRVHLDGSDVVAKVTAAGHEQANARRELAFYRTLADQVPVRTPTLLGHVDNDELTVLLLSAHTPAPPAREWDLSTWLEVARQLAALHSMPAPEGDLWVRTPWIRQVLDRPPRRAKDFWSRTAAADHIGDVFDAPAALAQGICTLPETFVHGDCHADNLLHDGDDLLWTDWQGTGIGNPAGDLAFLWGRAHADNADPPREAMIHAYATRRGIALDPLRRSLIASELSTLLYAWPDYAHYHPQDERDRLTQRLIDLTRDWHDPNLG
ncbi:MAG: aminoglycoside phosphotransferase family protein [Actinopolymorphaceae bacterium]